MALTSSASGPEAVERAERASCPCCGHGSTPVVTSFPDVPTNSVLLLRSAREARDFARGDIVLKECAACGFIFNATFEPELTRYTGDYEATQSYSGTFNRFNRRLAEKLFERYELEGKSVLEIGCGQGEFLMLFAELGAGRCIGYDPAYRAERSPAAGDPKITILPEFYSEKTAVADADLVCCKMTLEHIPEPRAFVSMLRRALGDSRSPVFLQVPNMGAILRRGDFWDVYYEHCSYFTAHSLEKLLQGCGFQVLDIDQPYGAQYLAIEARPSGPAPRNASHGGVEGEEKLSPDAARFSQIVQSRIASWNARIRGEKRLGRRVVVWGGGSKAVAFLGAIDCAPDIAAAVDINPHRQGSYLAGVGHEIVAPKELAKIRPHLVIVMNPLYAQEVESDLSRLGLEAEVVSLQ